MFIVVYGDIADGFSFVGPFPTATDAVDYINSEDDKSLSTTVVPLFRPDVDAKGLQEYAAAVYSLINK